MHRSSNNYQHTELRHESTGTTGTTWGQHHWIHVSLNRYNARHMGARLLKEQQKQNPTATMSKTAFSILRCKISMFTLNTANKMRECAMHTWGLKTRKCSITQANGTVHTKSTTVYSYKPIHNFPSCSLANIA